MSTAVSERPDACFERCGRGIEIRLTDLHMDDPGAFVIEFLGPLEDIHYQEWRNLFRSS